MSPTPKRTTRCFTLLEVMLSVAVFILLITTAFTLVGATTELMVEVSEVQNESAVRLRFVETCRSAFETMTAESSLEFFVTDRGGGRFDHYLSLVNAPEAFDFGMNRRDEIERVVIATEFQASGAIRSGVYYMTAADYETARDTDFGTIEAAYVELIPNMRQLVWKFYDENSQQWRSTLDGNFETSLIELTIQTTAGSPPLRTVYWYLNG